MLNYKNKLTKDTLDIKLIEQDIKSFEYIMDTHIRYDNIFADFDNQPDVIKEMLVNEWGTFEKISEWKNDKKKYISNIQYCIEMINNKEYGSFETRENTISCLIDNFNVLIYYFKPYAKIGVNDINNI